MKIKRILKSVLGERNVVTPVEEKDILYDMRHAWDRRPGPSQKKENPDELDRLRCSGF